MTTEENPEAEIQAGQPDDQSPDLKPEEQLQAIIEAAKSSRIAPADEDRAVQLLKQTVAGGPKALPATLDALLSLSWSVGGQSCHRGMARDKACRTHPPPERPCEARHRRSRRVRLSLARGLHAQDAASALKLIVSVCEAMGGAQGGSSTKDRQIFANVMLGKARPWLMNIAMAEMKPVEAHKIITPALESCQQAPIFTQIWVLRWICDAGKFDTLPPEHIESIGKLINRWQPRWRKELRKIIPKLPESLEDALADSNGRSPETAPTPTPPDASSQSDQSDQSDRSDLSTEPAAPANEPRPPAPQPSRPPEPPHRPSRDRQPSGPFDLNRSLREIEGYVARLRSELQQAQQAARRREPAPDRHRGRRPAGSGFQ